MKQPNEKSPQVQLNAFMAKYVPEVVATAKATLAKMRTHVPGAIEFVYDNYNGLVVGFGPNERPSDAVMSIVLFPRWVTLCFLQGGPDIPDPQRLLRGSGKHVRHMRLAAATD